MPADPLPSPGLGTANNTDPDECPRTVAAGLEMGYRHVDTAQSYDNEALVGRGLARSGVPREAVTVATKVADANLAADDVLATTGESLERLGVETIDLLYVHWPRDAYDAEETLGAFDELVDRGAIRHVGLSNFTPALLDEARDVLDAPVFAHQVEMHPLLPQEELVADAREHDNWLVAYSPLGTGEILDEPELVSVAEKHDATTAQVCLAWLASHENVVPIPKSSSEAHLRDNLAALDLALDDEDLATIDAIDRTERFIDPADAPWR